MKRGRDLKAKVGLSIKRIRKANGITQEETAHRAALDRAFVGRVERGEVNVSLDTLEKLAGALGVAVKDFFANEKT